MGFGIEHVSLVLSFVAIYYTWKESRTTNTVIVKILEGKTTSSQNMTENRGQLFDEFKVTVRNLGISLYDPQMALVFRPKSGMGHVTIPLNRRSRTKSELSEFGRGMIAEFGIKSFEIEPHHKPMFLMLEDVRTQEPSLVLFSQGYAAKTFKVWRAYSRLLRKWNTFAYDFNRKFEKHEVKDAMTIVKQRKVLPENLVDISLPLQFFVQRLRHPDR